MNLMAFNVRMCLGLVLLATSFFLVACVSKFPDQNIDPAKNNVTSYRKDLKECKEDYPEDGSGVYLRQRQGCMNLKGWR
jgi:outer membrane biogenesis lipoprotein LolB